jgi:hypothetical protein
MVDIAAGNRGRQARPSLWAWTDRRAQSQTGRVRRALIAVLTLIAATGIAATGVVVAEGLWVDQAEQSRGLMDGE